MASAFRPGARFERRSRGRGALAARNLLFEFEQQITMYKGIRSRSGWSGHCTVGGGGTRRMGLAGEIWIGRFQDAQRWRRRVEGRLRALPLTLTQWLVLDALRAIARETGDAVSQAQVGRRVELDKATVSYIMARLVLRGLIDRAPAYEAPEWRIYLTEQGKQLLERGRALIEATSSRLPG